MITALVLLAAVVLAVVGVLQAEVNERHRERLMRRRALRNLERMSGRRR